MDDLISRQAALEAVNSVIAEYIPTLYGRYEALPLEMAMAIKRLPTAEKKGEWIPKDDRWRCTLCDGIAPKGIRWNYCPNCGARMTEESE